MSCLFSRWSPIETLRPGRVELSRYTSLPTWWTFYLLLAWRILCTRLGNNNINNAFACNLQGSFILFAALLVKHTRFRTDGDVVDLHTRTRNFCVVAIGFHSGIITLDHMKAAQHSLHLVHQMKQNAFHFAMFLCLGDSNWFFATHGPTKLCLANVMLFAFILFAVMSLTCNT